MPEKSLIKILNINISNINYEDLIQVIRSAIDNNRQTSITYANVNSINIAQSEKIGTTGFKEMDIIHPDGIGVFLASKILYGHYGLKKRFTGSDFYSKLIKVLLRENWSVFFFGDEVETLQKISLVYPDLNISGFHDGFEYETNTLVRHINDLNPNILLVGLGSPKQENWILKVKHQLNVPVIIAVGDGIKMFSSTKKRGPKFLRIIGLEWLVRLICDPKRLWRRYIIGNPLFIFRILKLKISKSHFLLEHL